MSYARDVSDDRAKIDHVLRYIFLELGGEAMDLTMVVDILKVGLSGLIFLLMFFSYMLLATEQKVASPRPAILSSVKDFAWTCVLLIILVAGIAVFERVYIPDRNPIFTQQLEKCRDSLLRLQTLSAQSDSNLFNLQTLILNHAAVCNPAFEFDQHE